MPLRGGGGGRLMANAILNFHFDYVTTSLSEDGGPALPRLLHYHHPEPEVEAAHVGRLGWPGNGGEEHLEECQGLQGLYRRKL